MGSSSAGSSSLNSACFGKAASTGQISSKSLGCQFLRRPRTLRSTRNMLPNNIVYDRSEKRYFAADAFRPKFIELDAAAYLDRLVPNPLAATTNVESSDHSCHLSARLPVPQRNIASDVLRALLGAARGNRSIEILYQSMSKIRPEPLWRRVSPHAFASDGLRWHMRAYCHIDNKFKDFILSRCLDSRNLGETGSNSKSDQLWNSQFSVLLDSKPEAELGVSKVLSLRILPWKTDALSCRFAMPCSIISASVFALMWRRFDDPRETPVVVSNREELDAALSEAMR